jgi:quinolinate synthase
MDIAALHHDIREVKQRLGDELLLLAHHYQRQEIVAVADERGDSFQLARIAASRPEAAHIVFAGVRFMSEAARILAAPEQRVFMPEPKAGCPMADMADLDVVEGAWEAILEATKGRRVVPMAYMNSSSEIKAFCGRHGGTICTSSNAGRALTWAYEQGDAVLFFPDQHLGRNTALAMGMGAGEIALWRRAEADGGLSPEAIRGARLILWDGFCHVHTHFTPEQVRRAREAHPGARVIAHPECERAVVEAADGAGSTGFIVAEVAAAAPGDTLVIGTEVNLVKRLDQEFPDRQVVPLVPSVCPNMYRTTLQHVRDEIVALPEGLHEITVADDVIADARVALERMLALP